MASLTNEVEAREILARQLQRLIEMGYDGLTARRGTLKRSYLGGRLQVYEGSSPDVEEVVGRSGLVYQLEIDVFDEEDGELIVSVELTDERAGATLAEGCGIYRDGTVTRD